MHRIKYSAPAGFEGKAIDLNGYSSLQDLPFLFMLSTETADLDHPYPTDKAGAEITANYLEDATFQLADAVESIGYLMSVTDKDATASENHEQNVAGVGNALMVLGSLMKETSERAAGVRDFAQRAEK